MIILDRFVAKYREEAAQIVMAERERRWKEAGLVVV